MSNQDTLALIPRDTASTLNDFVGSFQRETLERVAAGIIDLSIVISAEGTENNTLFRMADMLHVALQYEISIIKNKMEVQS